MAGTGRAVARRRVEDMHENIRLKQQRFELSLGAKQVGAFVIAALLVMGAVFALGLGVGRTSAPAPAQPAAAKGDALAPLDEPLAAREEPPPELKAHQALTDSRSIDKTMPVPMVKSAKAPVPHGEEKSAPELEIPTAPPVVAAPAPAPSASNSPSASPSNSNSAAPATSTPVLPPALGSPRGGREPRPTVPVRASTRTASPRPGPVKAAPKGAYTVQVASASSHAGAERLAKQLAARRPRIVMADVPGVGRRYRVQIGAFDSREAAKREVDSLSQAGVQGIVTPAH